MPTGTKVSTAPVATFPAAPACGAILSFRGGQQGHRAAKCLAFAPQSGGGSPAPAKLKKPQ